MNHLDQFFINGRWVAPVRSSETQLVINPATEEVIAKVALGDEADVNAAVAAAKAAFATFSQSTREERIALLERILEAYRARVDEIGEAMSNEMGAPLPFAKASQAGLGVQHLERTIQVLRDFPFATNKGSTRIVKEPIGVCALITPWNWPMLQVICKVAPAIAAGCTVILKPSEIAPINTILFAEVMEAAGTPPGVFNLINGTGPVTGEALARHPDVDMVSITGSTRAGAAVMVAAASTIKRVHQELGGKSPNVVLPDVPNLEDTIERGVLACFRNTGQNCNAPTRMFVHESQRDKVLEIAKAAAAKVKIGDPRAADTLFGPLSNPAQFEKVQCLIGKGIEEGATLVTGGPGRPDGLERGFYPRPTVFADVTPDMTIAREEIFGPVLSILTYRTTEEAIALANDTPYGLAGYVQAGDLNEARSVAGKLRAGTIQINYTPGDIGAPVGGFKQSGNGREYAEYGIAEYLELKTILGHGEAA